MEAASGEGTPWGERRPAPRSAGLQQETYPAQSGVVGSGTLRSYGK